MPIGEQGDVPPKSFGEGDSPGGGLIRRAVDDQHSEQAGPGNLESLMDRDSNVKVQVEILGFHLAHIPSSLRNGYLSAAVRGEYPADLFESLKNHGVKDLLNLRSAAAQLQLTPERLTEQLRAHFGLHDDGAFEAGAAEAYRAAKERLRRADPAFGDMVIGELERPRARPLE